MNKGIIFIGWLILAMPFLAGCSLSQQTLDYERVDAFDFCYIPDAPALHVPADVESIAEAVNALGNYGRVIVSPGEYQANIEIPPGKVIVIQAEKNENQNLPELFPLDFDLPVIYVAPKAQLCLIDISLHGGRSGLVMGSSRQEEAAQAISLLNTHVANAEYGIYGLADQIRIEQSTVTNNIYGIVLSGSVSLSNSLIKDNEFNVILSGEKKPTCEAAAYKDTGKKIVVQNVTIMYGKQGGLAICNADSAIVKNAYIWKNSFVGVQIRNTKNFSFLDSKVGETQFWQDVWGDGLQVVHSSGLVKDSQFSANQRANLIYYGNSGGTIDNNLIIYGVLAIALEGLDGSFPSPNITNSNYMYGNINNKVSWGQNLPITPPPEIPDF